MPDDQHDEGTLSGATLAAGEAEIPLCVDLDGTLVKSDTLVDAILILARQQPRSPLSWPRWVRSGRAAFKREITSRAVVDVEHLPYNQPLLVYLREERARGRRIYLATAADSGFAEQVAAHFPGLFDGVLASDGAVNLAGANKLRAFQERFPEGFSYIGNAIPDRTLLAASTQPMVANPHGKLRTALRLDGTVVHREFADRQPTHKVFLKAIRLHQWAKNVLVFLPPVLAHQVTPATVVAAVLAFFALSFCASATYIINDLLDIEADRRHPRKRKRPFASGDLSPFAGVGIVVAFFVVAVVLALLVPVAYAALPGAVETSLRWYRFGFLMWLAVYTVTTLSYSFVLKKKVLVDVIVLSGLYTIRILAGSSATHVTVSEWLAAFSVFFFLSLAYVKRFSELELMIANNRTKASGRGYQTGDIEQLRSFGTGSGFAAVVVLSMYVSNLSAANLYSHVNRLWLLVPVIILWISQVWLLASRGELHEDPVVYAITDKRSWLLGAISAVIVWSAL